MMSLWTTTASYGATGWHATGCCAPARAEAVEYLLPQPINIRRVFVDQSTNPVTFSAGNNHGAEILRLQPLE
jgi:hypothetical protein